MQKTLALFIQNGLFEKHRQKMVAHYHEKSQQFRQLLEQSTVEKTHLHGTQLLLENRQLSLLKEQLDLEITINTLEDTYIEETTPQIFFIRCLCFIDGRYASFNTLTRREGEVNE